ncbi:MAG TPA: MarR family transcriptional regulator [Vitreimonas sp.]|uniref:MarR family winged helix-turn-helix transcriptional regulator n=1 Tax=Vitreimonas sp. TaxID=3069702 RepID=UPI002D63B4B1|nr:MarR family transcriptional regulator [Vitreimonas sp.]HYD86369.1 MarR family transcriptional regulator [Vitreimonas sp.]
MKKPLQATAEGVLDLSVAVIEFYFRIEAITQATAGFAQAGGEWGCLRSLVKDGPQTVPAMARARPVSRQHCQTICNALEAQGLVEFIDNPRHKKSKLVRVTRKGRDRFESMKKQFLAAAAVYAPLFTAAEVATATDVCRRARDMIEV